MNDTQTRASKEARKNKLLGILWDQKREDGYYKTGLEHMPEIKEYNRFKSLPEYEQQMTRKAWDEYYDACKNTTAKKRYFTIGEAWKRGDMKTVHDLAHDAREQLKAGDWELTKPSKVDPNVYDNGDLYIKYRYIKSELKQLEKGSSSSAKDAFL